MNTQNDGHGDDPRVTAYVLDELDAQERQQFELEMMNDPQWKQALMEYRDAAKLIQEAVSSETAPVFSLDPDRRRKVNQAILRAESSRGWPSRLLLPGLSLATLMVLAGVGVMFLKDDATMNRVVPEMAFTPDAQHVAVAELKQLAQELAPVGKEEVAYSTSRTAALAVGATEAPVAEQPDVDRLGGLQQPHVAAAAVETSALPAERLRAEKPADSKKGSIQGHIAYGNKIPAPAAAPATVSAPRMRSVSGYAADASVLAGSGVVPSRYRSDNLMPSENEGYASVHENRFIRIVDAESATSTFSADVDTASYSNIRRFINQGQLPPVDAVRIEEMLNYFTYDYAQPRGKDPFAPDVLVASCPWQPQHRLARIGIRAASVDPEDRLPMNLVFLIDVSGSMNQPNKLPLLKRSLRLMVQNLAPEDRVAIVTYAGSAGLVLESTPASHRESILSALENLKAGGSTAGGEGIRLAYETARQHRIEGAMNRVILCTDGDFNVGETNDDALLKLIRQRRNEGIFLNIFGFGMGNLKDERLEKLSNEGDGSYGYIDSFQEARKVFVTELQGTLQTVAKDVKFQIEFNPSKVAAYRLIGYENRLLKREDFNDDTKDAGEVGAGHTVTALYEIVPVGVQGTTGSVDPHRYVETTPQQESWFKRLTSDRNDSELFFLKIRHKVPDADESQLMTLPVRDNNQSASKAGTDFEFAAAVAWFGQLLRESRHAGGDSEEAWQKVLELARRGVGKDLSGHRAELVRLIETAATLRKH